MRDGGDHVRVITTLVFQSRTFSDSYAVLAGSPPGGALKHECIHPNLL